MKCRTYYLNSGSNSLINGMTSIFPLANGSGDIGKMRFHSFPFLRTYVVVGTYVVVSCFGHVKRVHVMEKSHSNIPAVATEQEKVPRGVFISSLGCGGRSGLIKTRFIMIGGKSSFTRMMNLYLWNDICAIH